MTKEEKKKLLTSLEDNAMYHTAIQSMSSESERRQVKAFVDDIYINLVGTLTGLLDEEQEVEQSVDGIDVP